MDHKSPNSEEILVTIRPGLHLTKTCFLVGTRHFELASLSEVETKQSSHDPLTRNSAVLAGSGLLLVALMARYMNPAGIAVSVTVLCGLAAGALLSAHARPRRQELWAVYKGNSVQIFGSDDDWLYGAVERQLRRSLAEIKMGGRPVRRMPRVRSVVPHPSMLHPSKMGGANRNAAIY